MSRHRAGFRASAAAVATAMLAWVAPACAQSQPWDVTVNQEVRTYTWSGTRGYPPATANERGSGWQVYAPLSVELSGKLAEDLKFELVGRGGYVSAKQTTPDASGSVSTVTDTVVAGTWTYLGIAGIQPFFSLSANLPSGDAVLSRTNGFARMDPDLVDLPTYGEGWNVGPSIGFNLPLATNLIVALGAGHTVRGSYERDASPLRPGVLTDLDPGDVTTVTGSVAFRNGPLKARLQAAYSHEGETELKGRPAYQLGDRTLVAGSASYAWNDASTLSIVASWNYYQKNEILDPPSPDLVTEAFNSNSSVYRIRAEHAFSFGNWSLGPVASFLVRDHNAYSPKTLDFVPAKTIWSAGGNIQYAIDNQKLLYVSVERLWVREDERPNAGADGSIPELSYTGWAVTAGGLVRF